MNKKVKILRRWKFMGEILMHNYNFVSHLAAVNCIFCQTICYRSGYSGSR